MAPSTVNDVETSAEKVPPAVPFSVIVRLVPKEAIVAVDSNVPLLMAIVFVTEELPKLFAALIFSMPPLMVVVPL